MKRSPLRRAWRLELALFVAIALIPSSSYSGEVRFQAYRPGRIDRTEITGHLYRPNGRGPFSAVALFHGSTGVLPYHHRWAEWLASEGYVALVVDSYGPRRVDKDSGGLTGERVWDAFGALAYLRSLDFVHKSDISAMGWSLGGGVALLASGELFAAQAPAPGTFSTVVAFYPACALTDASEIMAPVLFLLAAEDTWTPPERCLQIGRTLKSNGKSVEWAVYPGATHGFDFGRGDATASAINVGGHVLKYDERATADAEARIREFFGRQLHRTR
jgi:dienelactone hydrolase